MVDFLYFILWDWRRDCDWWTTARSGHLIYCYGNCNRDIDTNDPAALEDSSGEDLLKKYWLEAIERPCDLLKRPQRRPITNKKLFTVRFCE